MTATGGRKRNDKIQNFKLYVYLNFKRANAYAAGTPSKMPITKLRGTTTKLFTRPSINLPLPRTFA